MLSQRDNALLTQTDRGTPMGQVFRSFWIPALLSRELPARDGPPIKVSLLGEKLVAFRDSSGRVGLMEARCPHRHANLYWARNEDNGLRCVYHGWKFRVDGQCIDMPAEPIESSFKDRVRAVAYHTHEAGGIIWAYMGPEQSVPAFPEFDWMFYPDDYSYATKRFQRCNYLQNLEGELDSAHAYFLHREFEPGSDVLAPEDIRRPEFTVSKAPHGLVVTVRRQLSSGRNYWRITPFLAPTYTIIPTEQSQNEPDRFTAAVPMDDHNMWGFTVSWRRDRPLNHTEMSEIIGGRVSHVTVDEDTFLPVGNAENDYLIDRASQKENSFTGIPGIRLQDLAVQEDQDGPICRRDEEHLGATDKAIIATRRLLLEFIKGLDAGKLPSPRDRGETYRLRSIAIEADSEEPWERIWLRHQGDENPGALSLDGIAETASNP